MNPTRFDYFMSSINDSLLEEALHPYNRRQRTIKIMFSAAACFCLVAGALIFFHPLFLPSTENSVTSQDLDALNYNLPDLEGHSYSIDYALYDSEESAPPLAEAVLTTKSNTEYIVRSLKTKESIDISGLVTENEPFLWTYGPLEFQLCSNSTSSWLSWYSNELQLQYCISTQGDPATLLQTAADIIKILGYDMAVSPEDASEVLYRVFLYDGLTIAETSFLYEETRYSFRMAATTEIRVPFADISGTDNTYETHLSGELLWCPAELYFNEGGAGKIIWFDIVPGLLYSLSADNNASETSLLSVAELLFDPAQDNN